jgi:hypothetical protein
VAVLCVLLRAYQVKCVGHSCLLRSYDKSKQCTQHPKLAAALLTDLQREQEHFAFS